MKIIQTGDLSPEVIEHISQTEKHWIYNGLDAAVTLEVLNAVLPLADDATLHTYDLSRALQGPILEMNMRGVLVDQNERAKTIAGFEADIKRLETQLRRITEEGIGFGFSIDRKTGQLGWRSPAQTAELLYNVMGLPPVRKRNSNGIFAPTVDREALEKLSDYYIAQPVISHLLALRDLGKKAGVLRTDIDSDGRMRTSYNIAGTTTGRLSSSLSDFGSGTNLQNIEQRLRRVFVADSGMKFANIDLEQADSRNVGAICWNLFNDGRYLDACESGDLHTSVCRMAWQGLPWGNDPSVYRAVADMPFYRQHSYRHMAKVLGHGTNYVGTPHTMAKHTKVEQTIIKEFQAKYFAAFPAIPRWHGWVAGQLLSARNITTVFGRRRYFFGRPDDASTVREAVAHMGQSMTADELSLGLLEVFRLNLVQLLLQVHDSILIQYPEEREDEILPRVMKAIQVRTVLNHGREFVVPADCKVGWNWADQETDKNGNEWNPDGLRKYRGHDARARTSIPSTSLLDRCFY